MDDKKLRQDIIEELEAHPHFEAQKIGVSVDRGVVCLTGRVGDPSHKALVERAVWQVPGVQAIATELDCAGDAGWLDRDAGIARRAIDILSWNLKDFVGQVSVRVEKRKATLTGWTTSEGDRQLAAQLVKRHSGATAVDNLLAVRGSKAVHDC